MQYEPGFPPIQDSTNSGEATASASSLDKLIARRYRLGKMLGSGSFGQVYYAEDIKFEPARVVAIKLLFSRFTNDAVVREELKREASSLARFSHPNILRVLDFEVADTLSFIVTEFAAGGSLQHRLQPNPAQPPQPLPLEEVLSYFDQLSDALDQAHAQGVVHRDIKPHNILLDAQGRPLLADFGLAAAVNSSSSSLMDTTPSGTPLYMSPEQWQGQVGKASDIYSFGVVIFQLLAGQTPYKGNTAALAWQHCNAPVPNLTNLVPELKDFPQVNEVIAQALAKQAEQRPRSAREFYQNFLAALQRGAALPTMYPQTQPNSSFLVEDTLALATPQVPELVAWPSVVEPATPVSASKPASNAWYVPADTSLPTKPTSKMQARWLMLTGTLGLAVVVLAVSIVWVLNNPNTNNRPSATATLEAAATVTVAPLTTITTSLTSNPSPTQPIAATQPIVPTIGIATPNVNLPTIEPAPTATSKPVPTAVQLSAPIVRGKVGETLKYQDYALNISTVTISTTVEGLAGSIYQAAPDMQFVLVNVTYTNGAAETDLHTNLFFHSPTIRDSNNFIYSYDSLRSKIPALNDITDNLQVGDKVQGWLTYQLPKTAKGLVFEFQLRNDNPFVAPLATFQVALDASANFTLSPDPTPNGVGATGKLGQITNSGAYFMTVNKVETANSIDNTNADAGKQFVMVEMTFQSKANQGVDINNTNLKLKDGDGFRYDNTFRRQPELQTTSDLPSGTKIHGWATFEVPTTATNFSLQFQQSSDNPPILTIKLS
jgi:serine/threonine-protein kinase